MYRMEKIVPLIGATVQGPLGVSHLPRMWLKSVLSGAGMLWEGYFDNDKGFNHRVVAEIGLEPEAWFAFLATLPTYPQAEDYVRAHATNLNPASIAALNQGIATFLRPEENAVVVREKIGLADKGFTNSEQLLQLDDWWTIHNELVTHRQGGIEPLVPMVSSSQVSLLGIPHLPRLWIKALLNAVGALPKDWKTGKVCGFDNRLAGLIGLDIEATSAYINSELPNYLQFESWVRDHIAQPDAATKAKWIAEIAAMKKADEQGAAEVIECGATDPTIRGTVMLNDMVDWKHMHDHIVSKRVAHT